jgi:Reverse transcriptase (RNA-dependent DNA polymerase)
LGLPWLREHNLEINWKEGTLQWRTTTMEEVLDEKEHLNLTHRTIFSDMIEERRVIVYMDNILIFAESQEELQKQTKQVLQRLWEHNLFLKPKKC